MEVAHITIVPYMLYNITLQVHPSTIINQKVSLAIVLSSSVKSGKWCRSWTEGGVLAGTEIKNERVVGQMEEADWEETINDYERQH